jgi:hypothetical protein
VRRLLSISCALMLLSSLVAGLPTNPRLAAAADCRTFPETGVTVCEPFISYWDSHGGLAQQGLPLAEAFFERSPVNGEEYFVQYFERAVMEFHRDGGATGNPVLLSLLGRERFLARYPDGPPPTSPPPPGAECATFAETGKTVCGPFLAYWRERGGLAQQGFPLSDAFEETSTVDGRTYTVQYFERAVFEHHPEYAGTPYEVLLSLLGGERLRAEYPNGTPTNAAPPPSAPPSPTPRPSPSPSPSPAPPTANVILRDDFSNPQSGWTVETSTQKFTRYEGGAYRMYVYKGGTYIAGFNSRLSVLRDVGVEVDVNPAQSAHTGAFGVLCRVRNSQNFYILWIDNKGGGGIHRYQNGVGQRLAATTGPHAAIRPGKATNRLRAECVGDTLTLYVNGVVVAVAQDTQIETGDVALYTEALTGPTSVLFDNVVVYKP